MVAGGGWCRCSSCAGGDLDEVLLGRVGQSGGDDRVQHAADRLLKRGAGVTAAWVEGVWEVARTDWISHRPSGGRGGGEGRLHLGGGQAPAAHWVSHSRGQKAVRC